MTSPLTRRAGRDATTGRPDDVLTEASEAVLGGFRPGRSRSVARVAAAMCGALLLAALASVVIGSQSLPPTQAWAALTDTSHPGHALVATRLDRTLLAAATGAALALAGALLQGLTRNPLADPGILGINAGAGFAMVLAMAYLPVTDLSGRIWFAFAGAAVAALVVHGIAAMGAGGATPVKLAVAGAAVAAAVTSWSTAVLLIDRSTMESIRFWQVGTVGGRGLDVLLTGLPFLVAGGVLALVGARVLDAMALGDDVARGLGRSVARDKVLVGVAVVLLAGTATAMAGPIAFVGLLVPHALRAVVGPAHHRLLPLTALGGALLVVVADTLGRVVLPPSEMQVGIMVAVVGVPGFLLLVRRGRMGAL